MTIDEVKARVKEIFTIGDRRHTERGRTGSVNLNELLTPISESIATDTIIMVPIIRTGG
jgi:hypothetical protein